MEIMLHSNCSSRNTQKHSVLRFTLPQTSFTVSPIMHQDTVENTGFKDIYFPTWVLVATHINLDQYLCSHILKSVSGAFQHHGRISDESYGEEERSDQAQGVYPSSYIPENLNSDVPGVH